MIDPNEPFLRLLSHWTRVRAHEPMIVSHLTGSVLEGGALGELIATRRQRLAGFGFLPGHRIVSALARGGEQAAVALSIAAYASYVPLHPEQSFEEWRAALRAVRPAALLIPAEGNPNGERAAVECGVPLLRLAGLRLDFDGGALPPPNALPGERFLLQTSGTVRPKYVPKTGAGLCATVEQMCASIPFTPQDCCLVTVPSYHSLAIVSLTCLPALTGGCAVHVEGPAQVFEACARYPVTWMATPPAALWDMVRFAKRTQTRPRRPLRLIRTAGASVPAELAAEASTVFGAPVLAGYSSTEAPFIANARLGDPPAVNHSGRVSPGVELRIDQPGGEIRVSSASMATTYWNDPEATRAAFVTDVDGRVWYRTGDVGHLDADGNLHLLGRKSDIINRGGFKVAPWEVEGALGRHPAVAEVVAFAVPDARLGEEVASAVTLRPGATPTGAELRAFVSRQLMVAKVPRRVFVVDAIPRNGMGKALRGELSQWFAGQMRERAPRRFSADDPLALGLVRICEEVLGLEGAGLDDNFFDLGGDSATALDFLARVGDEYGGAGWLEPSLLFEANSFTMLARRLRMGGGARPSNVAVLRAGEGVPLVIVCPDPEAYASPWRAMVRELPPERPVYLLKPEPYVPTGAATFADIARLLNDTLREALPHGPYALAGSCLMGGLAQEMAVQLERSGARVPVVFAVDPWFPYADRGLKLPDYLEPRRLLGVWRESGGTLAGFARRAQESLRRRWWSGSPDRPDTQLAKSACRAHTMRPVEQARVVTIWCRHVEELMGHPPEVLWRGVSSREPMVVERFECDRATLLAGAKSRELAALVERHTAAVALAERRVLMTAAAV